MLLILHPRLMLFCLPCYLLFAKIYNHMLSFLLAIPTSHARTRNIAAILTLSTLYFSLSLFFALLRQRSFLASVQFILSFSKCSSPIHGSPRVHIWLCECYRSEDVRLRQFSISLKILSTSMLHSYFSPNLRTVVINRRVSSKVLIRLEEMDNQLHY